MKNKSVGGVIFICLTSFLWIAWVALWFTVSNVDSWKEEASRDLVALKTRVEIVPGRHVVESFKVHYDAPHYVGFAFDDRGLSDSLMKYIGWFKAPEFGLGISWTLYDGQDSLVRHSLKTSTGGFGKTCMFGEFDAKTGKQYKLDIVATSLPKFVERRGAYLEVGVGRADVGVGNDFGYALLGAIARSLSVPVLWAAIASSAIMLLYFWRRQIKHVNGN